ncbi:MAG: Fe-S-containing hydro-lyase [candidate division KSB1 bacterium]|nr:Fe-S-containing hydro-lyase [candidate division KSB1 bacterium]
MTQSVKTPFTDTTVNQLRAGDSVTLSGIIYTARDAAHKRLVDLIDNGSQLPFDLRGQVIYYVGPAPARPGYPLGSAGPTTSMRMDRYAPVLIENGLNGIIGKGEMGAKVAEALQEHNGVYFAAIGGAGALIAQCVTYSRIIAWEDLGPEAVRELTIVDMPLIVAQDSRGNNLFRDGKAAYEQNIRSEYGFE